MLTKNGTDDKKTQIQLISLDQLVPEDHLLRKIDKYIDFDFIYDLVEEKYSTQTGRPSIDPVTLIKIPIIQYMYGINSMRQTIREIEVNMAYRWFLIDFYDKVLISAHSERTTKEGLKELICSNRFSKISCCSA